MDKEELREEIKIIIDNINDKEERSKRIEDRVINLAKGFNNIALYASIKSEVATLNIINKLLEMGKNVYLPKIEGDIICFYKIASVGDLVLSKGKYKIYEPVTSNLVNPSDLDLIICPGLAFDKSNNRLGRGKGYYDKYLAKTRSYKVGICFKEQMVDSIEVTPNDIKMDLVIFE